MPRRATLKDVNPAAAELRRLTVAARRDNRTAHVDASALFTRYTREALRARDKRTAHQHAIIKALVREAVLDVVGVTFVPAIHSMFTDFIHHLYTPRSQEIMRQDPTAGMRTARASARNAIAVARAVRAARAARGRRRPRPSKAVGPDARIPTPLSDGSDAEMDEPVPVQMNDEPVPRTSERPPSPTPSSTAADAQGEEVHFV